MLSVFLLQCECVLDLYFVEVSKVGTKSESGVPTGPQKLTIKKNK